MLKSASTHEVLNQPPPIAPYNVFEADRALGEALVAVAVEKAFDEQVTVDNADAAYAEVRAWTVRGYLSEGEIDHFQVRLKVGFRLDEDGS